MSAWICSQNHISAIVEAAIDAGKIDPAAAKTLGQSLWDTNVESVNHRYPDNQNTGYVYAHRPYPVRYVQLQKLLHCYAYQSCEHDGWIGSASERLVTSLTGYRTEELPGYDAAEWGVD